MLEAPRPERSIVAALKRIDPTLSAAFCEPPGRWGIFHGLQVAGNPEQTADLVARELQIEAAKAGYILPLSECQYAAMQGLRDAKLVCYVVEEDGPNKGGYRPLDGRILTKLQRMDYNRRNLGLRDWKELLRAKADVLADRRRREQGDVWDVIRRDSVFARQASDILWGQKPTRSVVVPGCYEPPITAASRAA